MIGLYRGLLAAALLALWYLGVGSGVLSPLFFGHPTAIAKQIIEWFVSGEIWPHLALTIGETLMAFAAGTTMGVLAGLWLG